MAEDAAIHLDSLYTQRLQMPKAWRSRSGQWLGSQPSDSQRNVSDSATQKHGADFIPKRQGLSVIPIHTTSGTNSNHFWDLVRLSSWLQMIFLPQPPATGATCVCPHAWPNSKGWTQDCGSKFLKASQPQHIKGFLTFIFLFGREELMVQVDSCRTRRCV